MTEIKYLNGTNGVSEEKLYNVLYKIEKQWTNGMANDSVSLMEYAEKIYRNAIILGAVEKDEIVGICAAYVNNKENQQAYLTYIALMMSFANKGLGTELLHIMENTAIEAGMKSMKLEVNKRNYDALRFYKKNRYNITAEKNDDSYFMVKYFD